MSIPLSKQILSTLYSYDANATTKIFEAAAALSPEQLEQSMPGHSHGGILSTLFHMLRAMTFWRSSFDGDRVRVVLNPADFQTLDSVYARWREESAKMRAYVDGLNEEQIAEAHVLNRPNAGEQRIVTWHMLQQVALHGMQHRAECAAMLTALGRSPGDLDFIYFV